MLDMDGELATESCNDLELALVMLVPKLETDSSQDGNLFDGNLERRGAYSSWALFLLIARIAAVSKDLVRPTPRVAGGGRWAVSFDIDGELATEARNDLELEC